jgi:hypothetical protein
MILPSKGKELFIASHTEMQCLTLKCDFSFTRERIVRYLLSHRERKSKVKERVRERGKVKGKGKGKRIRTLEGGYFNFLTFFWSLSLIPLT